MVCLSKSITLPSTVRTEKNTKADFPPLYLRSLNSSNLTIKRKEASSFRKAVLYLSDRPQPKVFVFDMRTCGGREGEKDNGCIGDRIWALCGFGFWIQGFRCFPWLAFNFHMAHSLNLRPSTLQMVQNVGNLPMVAKPLFGILSDAFYIGGAHRIPYISIGAFLQAFSWGILALITTDAGTFPTQMVCILFSNLGASVTEVASDALVVEFSKTRKAVELQSFTYAYLAVGALLGNLFGGFFLLKFAKPKFMFFIFAFLLTIQLALSITTKETSLHPAHDSIRLPARKSLKESLGEQFAHLVTAIRQTRILHPLLWIIASNMVVPLLSGSIFCFQTQCLVLDPFVIGLSKVVGQLIVLLNTALYNRYLKAIPMRRLIFGVQLFYALSFLSDLILVKQLNVAMGIPNDVYVLCISSLSEAIAQFKTLPFTILFSRLCPSGCEGSLFAFLASALCLSSILSGVLGVGLASYLGVSPENYSSLPVGIVIQILAALLPLGWISYVPSVRNLEIKMG